MARNGRNERRRRTAQTGDARAILESWLPTGPADVSGLLADQPIELAAPGASPLD
ncbi:hypothetical protein [Candidatus Poriferisodalis sp.]|uniref:hypothetical protein n=1 Tax=Candidatus Poriferisodalis sp. TaxID=3101277 RepID=UPI003AF4825D